MTLDARLRYLRMLRQYLALGVSETAMAEVVVALSPGADPREVAAALNDLVPQATLDKLGAAA